MNLQYLLNQCNGKYPQQLKKSINYFSAAINVLEEECGYYTFGLSDETNSFDFEIFMIGQLILPTTAFKPVEKTIIFTYKYTG